MKALLTILVAGLFAFGARRWVGTAREPARPVSAESTAELDGLRTGIAALRAENERLAGELARLEGALEEAPALSSGVSDEEIAAALERWRAAHPREVAAVDARDATVGRRASLPSDIARVPMSELLPLLRNEGLSDFDREQLFQELREAGRIDEYVAEMEKLAAEDPRNAALQTALGVAYLQKLFEVGPTPEAGIWALQADQAFDRALEIDDHNWGARFTKAVSLSNWPAFLGRGAEALENLEILLDQQEQSPPRPEFAMTYLFLGNLYQSGGERAKALETWRDGLELFPDSEELRRALELAGE